MYERVETQPGLSHYVRDLPGLASKALQPLLIWAKAVVPTSQWGQTPVFLLATGAQGLPAACYALLATHVPELSNTRCSAQRAFRTLQQYLMSTLQPCRVVSCACLALVSAAGLRKLSVIDQEQLLNTARTILANSGFRSAQLCACLFPLCPVVSFLRASISARMCRCVLQSALQSIKTGDSVCVCVCVCVCPTGLVPHGCVSFQARRRARTVGSPPTTYAVPYTLAQHPPHTQPPATPPQPPPVPPPLQPPPAQPQAHKVPQQGRRQ